jgi:hypothetical protein
MRWPTKSIVTQVGVRVITVAKGPLRFSSCGLGRRLARRQCRPYSYIRDDIGDANSAVTASNPCNIHVSRIHNIQGAFPWH